jgi:hypothetical protein
MDCLQIAKGNGSVFNAKKMKPLAVTLVHKAAMPIARHAVKSFARHFSDRYRLEIHTDGSPDERDQAELLAAAGAMDTRIVTPEERAPLLEERLQAYPNTRALLDGVGYNAKLELPMVLEPPYFYFDSDIVWLRAVSNLAPSAAPNAFSAESWSWYNGIAKDHLWIKAKTPQRVNSGLYYLSEPFPFARLEDMLGKGMYDRNRRYPGDQEIMAYLFPSMELYHPEDIKRSRVGVCYNLKNDTSSAIHFPGQMWRNHLDQIEELLNDTGSISSNIRYVAPQPLTKKELLLMRMRIESSDSFLLRHPINMIRKMRQLSNKY